MKEKIKKLFLSSSWDKKQLILAVLVLVGLGLIMPTSSTQAIGWGWLANPVAIAIAIIVLQFLVATTSAILWLATSILSWVTSENFISLPYTSEGIVEIGWPLCRDFANMAIIVFLVIIGLATALRIRDYEAKKALPVLIIVALLVNFSPVICGFFIDAANIVMNWFLEGIKNVSDTYGHFFNLGKGIIDLLGKGDVNDFNSLLVEGLIIRPLVMSVFNVGAAFIIFLFSFIFVLRYIALWALVILSPLAFVSYILPVTRRFWNMWWNQFVQWTIIGITMGFFLYLGFQLLGITTSGEVHLVASDLPESAEAPNPVAWLLDSLLPYFVVLAFLGLGFFIGLSSGAAGATQIISGGKRAGKWVARTTGRLSKEAVRGIPAVSKAEAAARRRLEMIPLVGRALGGPGGYSAELARARVKAAEDLKGRGPDEIRAKIKTTVLREDRIVRAKGMEMLADMGAFKDEDKDFLADAKEFGADMKKITARMPIWADDIAERVKSISSEKAPQIQAEGINLEVAKNLNLSQLERIGTHGDEKLRTAIYRELENNPDAFEKKIAGFLKERRAAGRW
jgi:hypothetical protein